nr:hypothetical protein [Tanacetum cinerariifolium]
ANSAKGVGYAGVDEYGLPSRNGWADLELFLQDIFELKKKDRVRISALTLRVRREVF